MFDFLHLNPEYLLAANGYWAVLLLVGVESTGIPVPGETMLLVASVYAGATHRLQVPFVILAAAAGAVLGDNLGFHVGRQGGYRLVRRYGEYVRVDEDKLRLGRYLFDLHGGKLVFFGRFVPVLRMWAAFLSGANRMSWRRFLVFNAAGGIVWATIMGLAAFEFGSSMLRLGGVVGLSCGVVVTLAMAAFMLALHRKEQGLQHRADIEFGCLKPVAQQAAAA